MHYNHQQLLVCNYKLIQKKILLYRPFHRFGIFQLNNLWLYRLKHEKPHFHQQHTVLYLLKY